MGYVDRDSDSVRWGQCYGAFKVGAEPVDRICRDDEMSTISQLQVSSKIGNLPYVLVAQTTWILRQV
jgi:hypothetical protein